MYFWFMIHQFEKQLRLPPNTGPVPQGTYDSEAVREAHTVALDHLGRRVAGNAGVERAFHTFVADRNELVPIALYAVDDSPRPVSINDATIAVGDMIDFEPAKKGDYEVLRANVARSLAHVVRTAIWNGDLRDRLVLGGQTNQEDYGTAWIGTRPVGSTFSRDYLGPLSRVGQ